MLKNNTLKKSLILFDSVDESCAKKNMQISIKVLRHFKVLVSHQIKGFNWDELMSSGRTN